MSNMFSLEGKIALVTGASYGIGFAIACAMSDAGATIVFNDIKQELVDKGIAAYAEKGIKAHGYVCDVTDEAAVNALVAKIEEEVGVIDILVNNAGIIKRIPMCEMTAEQFRQVIDVDLNAPFIVSKAVIPSMIKKGHGKIINICSMMSELGRETVSAYAAAKGGLKMLTRNICSEYGKIWAARRCSLRRTRLTSSMATSFMWMAAFWRTLASSPDECAGIGEKMPPARGVLRKKCAQKPLFLQKPLAFQRKM